MPVADVNVRYESFDYPTGSGVSHNSHFTKPILLCKVHLGHTTTTAASRVEELMPSSIEPGTNENSAENSEAGALSDVVIALEVSFFVDFSFLFLVPLWAVLETTGVEDDDDDDDDDDVDDEAVLLAEDSEVVTLIFENEDDLKGLWKALKIRSTFLSPSPGQSASFSFDAVARVLKVPKLLAKVPESLLFTLRTQVNTSESFAR